MSEDTEKKPHIGGIGQQRQQYRTIGGQHQDTQTSERRDVQESEHRSSQEPERPETLKRLNVQEPEHAGTEANKRERHTIYLPPELSEWLRVRAARKRQEMSEIATEAIQRYKDETER
jgi:hypothetical protein